MKGNIKYVFIAIGLIIVGYLLWYFKSIISYILLSVVLSLIGRPLKDLLNKIRIRKFTMPKWLSALITLIAIWALVFFFFRIFIPILASEANDLSNIDIQSVAVSIQEPIDKVENFLARYKITNNEENFNIEDYISTKIWSVLNFTNVSNLFGIIAGLLGNIFVAVFSLSFITFFFLKDDKLFVNGILIFVPEKHEEGVRHVLQSIKKLLTRYFIGILIQTTLIILLVTTGQTIVGVGFQHALVIGLFAGLLNIIPYIGPWIGVFVGLTLGLATHLQLDFSTEILPMLMYMLVVFLIVQTMDNLIFQPVIFSNSVNAHPLEIFIVILVAGYSAGVVGMILAIPSYTVIRVIGKEFFNKYKVVKKLTKKI